MIAPDAPPARPALPRLILASGSSTRAALLRGAGIAHEVVIPRVDEDGLTAALRAKGTSPRDVADALAEMKAVRVSARHPETIVLGGDQVLSCDGRLYAKPATPEEAREHLDSLAGRTHVLHSAAVLAEGGEPVWRHVGEARLTMGSLSPGWLDDYVARNWDSIRHSVGGYRIEEEGVRLFTRIEGDHFTILGLPLLPLLSFLTARGSIPS